MSKSDQSPPTRLVVEGEMNCMAADLPPEIDALLDAFSERKAWRNAKARRESREDAARDQREAARRGISTAELPPFNKGDL